MINDADIEQANLEALGNHEARLKKQGKCTHGWRQGPDKDGLTKCLDCGKVATDEELEEERAELLM